jgi:C-terminal processing protease CtpA/Prc
MGQTDDVARAGVRPGLALISVDGKPVAERVAYWRELKTASTEQATNRLAYFRVLTGPRNSTVEVVVEDADGKRRSVRLTRSERHFNDTNLEPDRLHASRELEPGIGYFQANQMSDPVGQAFTRYVEGVGTLTALILDLRYNGGGSDVVSSTMVSRLIDTPIEGQVHEVTAYRADRRAYRQEQEIVRTPVGRIRPATGTRFTGRLIVLIGEQTHSAAEGGFLSVVRNRPNTIFVGEPTAGSTGQPMSFALLGGGLGVVCSVRTLGPGGRPFVGVGFHPDVGVSPTQLDVFRGLDPVLARATELAKRP